MVKQLRPSVCAWIAATLLVVPSAAFADSDGSGKGVRMNELQVIGTHNSYKRETSPAEQAQHDALVGAPQDYERFLAYSHPDIAEQFGRQGVRGLELDLFADPEGGLYANPLARQRAGLGPLADPAWREPGIKTFHIADTDYETSCVRFTTCLEEIRAWSRANRGHVPLFILLELKRSDSRVVNNGGVVAPPWEAARLDELDAEIRSVFREHEMITPDDVRRRGKTLEQSVLEDGWPSLERARGKVVFLLDNEPGAIRDAYTAGRPSLEGRVLFTNSRPSRPDAAFIKRNEPRNANTTQIQDLVRQGYLVRTRSDIPLETVTSGDRTMLEAAIRSGAHVISTDFPEPGMSARYGSDFVALLPGGLTFRCNPIVAGPSCRDERLERLRGRRR